MEHIHPLEPIAVIVLVVIFLYLRRKQKRGGAAAGSTANRLNRARTPEEIYMDMRREALATTPQNLGRDPKGTEPYGLLMEMAIQISAMTLVCFVDGDANVYYKNGGGMIGGSSHESVRKAAKAFVALAAKALAKMTKMPKTADYPLPGMEKVRFYALTPQGVFTTETNRQALSRSKSELGALFYAGQEVVAEMRQVQEQKQGDKKPLRAKVPMPTSDLPLDADADPAAVDG